MKKVLFISSIGGHLSELMRLEPLFKDYEYTIITEKGATTEYLQDEYNGRVYYVPYSTRRRFLVIFLNIHLLL